MNGNSTVLIRQVHPSFIKRGFATSQAFRPTPKDEMKLSVYDGDMITPEKSFDHYTNDLKCESAGTVGLTVEECLSEDLQVHPDPEPFPEHAVIDFGECSSSRCEKKSRKLQGMSQKRGWLFSK